MTSKYLSAGPAHGENSFSGFLEKDVKARKKRRFFILDGQRLIYYKDRNAQTELPLGEIRLVGATVEEIVKQRKNKNEMKWRFLIKSVKKRGSIRGKQMKSKDFTLTAANDTDFLLWTRAIRSAIEGKSLRGQKAAAFSDLPVKAILKIVKNLHVNQIGNCITFLNHEWSAIAAHHLLVFALNAKPGDAIMDQFSEELKASKIFIAARRMSGRPVSPPSDTPAQRLFKRCVSGSSTPTLQTCKQLFGEDRVAEERAEYQKALKRMSRWLSKPDMLPCVRAQAFMLAFPTYYFNSEMGGDSSAASAMAVLKSNTDLMPIVLVCWNDMTTSIRITQLDITVGQLKEKILKKYISSGGGTEEDLCTPGVTFTDRCVFKMMGYSDYLLWNDRLVIEHKHVLEQLMLNAKGRQTHVKLKLVDLSEAQVQERLWFKNHCQQWVSGSAQELTFMSDLHFDQSDQIPFQPPPAAMVKSDASLKGANASTTRSPLWLVPSNVLFNVSHIAVALDMSFIVSYVNHRCRGASVEIYTNLICRLSVWHNGTNAIDHSKIPVVEEIALTLQSEGDANSLWELSGGAQQHLTADLPVKALSRGTSLLCELLTSEKKRSSNVVASAELTLFDYDGCIRTGQIHQRLLPCTMAADTGRKKGHRKGSASSSFDLDDDVGLAEVSLFLNPELMYMHTLHTPADHSVGSLRPKPTPSPLATYVAKIGKNESFELPSPRRLNTPSPRGPRDEQLGIMHSVPSISEACTLVEPIAPVTTSPIRQARGQAWRDTVVTCAQLWEQPMYKPVPAQIRSMWECRHRVINCLQRTIEVRVMKRQDANSPGGNAKNMSAIDFRSLSVPGITSRPKKSKSFNSDGLVSLPGTLVLGRSCSEQHTTSSSGLLPDPQKMNSKAARLLGVGVADPPPSKLKNSPQHNSSSPSKDKLKNRRSTTSLRPPKPYKVEKNAKGIGGMGNWVRDRLLGRQSSNNSKSDLGAMFQGTIVRDPLRAFWPLFAHLVLGCDYSRSQTVWEMRQLLVTILATIETTRKKLAELEAKAPSTPGSRGVSVYGPFVPLEVCLELLSRHSSDPFVRAFAVRCLSFLSDSELSPILLQLVQLLKNEHRHDSALARLLLWRALRNPAGLGHRLFWFLRSEMEQVSQCPAFVVKMNAVKKISRRRTASADKNSSFGSVDSPPAAAATSRFNFTRSCTATTEYSCFRRMKLLLGLYLMHGKPHVEQLTRQFDFNYILTQTCLHVRKLGDKPTDTKTAYARMLLRLCFRSLLRGKVSVPLSPRWVGDGIVVEKSRVFSSKMAPLKIVLRNVDGKQAQNLALMFKVGDDLRQDALTVQVLTAMQHQWWLHSLNLMLNPYGCVSAGYNMGYIEFVQDASTIGQLQNTGGSGKAAVADLLFGKAALKAGVSMGHVNKKTFALNFARSSVGYCLATYILGIADRHPSNIMLDKEGRLFHIDFGHVLGHFKSKYGFKRERTEVAFYANLEKILKRGGTLDDFNDLSFRSLRVLRRISHLIVRLFLSMVPAAMPEISKEIDVNYISQHLHLNTSNESASTLFLSEVHKATNDLIRNVDNHLHISKHYDKRKSANFDKKKSVNLKKRLSLQIKKMKSEISKTSE